MRSTDRTQYRIFRTWAQDLRLGRGIYPPLNIADTFWFRDCYELIEFMSLQFLTMVCNCVIFLCRKSKLRIVKPGLPRVAVHLISAHVLTKGVLVFSDKV